MERKYEDLSDPKIMSYQFLHPELAEYIQSMAVYILGEVRNSVKGERFYTEHEGDITITGTSKYVSETVQRIQDETGATYAEITQALQNIIEGKGAENTALAKKIELILDDNLTEGYTTFEGIEIPPDMDYILAKKQVEQKLKKQSTYSQDSRAPQTLDEFKAKWEASEVPFYVYEKKGDTVVLSKLIVPEEQRNQGIGTQFMRNLIAYADLNNKTIALTPSSDFGDINQLKKSFIKRLGFVENKAEKQGLRN